VSSPPPLPDAIFSHPRYKPGEVLGHGAQGVVLRVVDHEAPARALVAKVWRARERDEFRLAGEFALLARLRIRGLVRAHDFAHDERTGAPFFVEDFVDGQDAAAWVAEARGAQANARMLALAADVAAALAGLHDAGFVHGDLKPAHVRVVQRAGGAQAVLLDLGAAASRARAAEGPSAFTPAYAAPEVRAGERGDECVRPVRARGSRLGNRSGPTTSAGARASASSRSDALGSARSVGRDRGPLGLASA